MSLGKAQYSLGTLSCWRSPNLNHFDIKHIASLKEPSGRQLSPPGDCTRPSLETTQGEQQERQGGCWRKLRAELDLLKGEEDVARDKVDAPKPKRRLLDINESDDDSDGEGKMDELTRF